MRGLACQSSCPVRTVLVLEQRPRWRVALHSFAPRAAFTEMGFESRPSCHVVPSQTPRLDTDDASVWLLTTDLACQVGSHANA